MSLIVCCRYTDTTNTPIRHIEYWFQLPSMHRRNSARKTGEKYRQILTREGDIFVLAFCSLSTIIVCFFGFSGVVFYRFCSTVLNNGFFATAYHEHAPENLFHRGHSDDIRVHLRKDFSLSFSCIFSACASLRSCRFS